MNAVRNQKIHILVNRINMLELELQKQEEFFTKQIKAQAEYHTEYVLFELVIVSEQKEFGRRSKIYWTTYRIYR